MASGTTTFSAVIESNVNEGGSHLLSLISSDINTQNTNNYDLITQIWVESIKYLYQYIELFIIIVVFFICINYLLGIAFMLITNLARRYSQFK